MIDGLCPQNEKVMTFAEKKTEEFKKLSIIKATLYNKDGIFFGEVRGKELKGSFTAKKELFNFIDEETGLVKAYYASAVDGFVIEIQAKPKECEGV